MQYRETGTAAWKAISSTTLDMKGLINGRPNVSVDIRYKAAGGLSASKPAVIDLH